MPVKKLKNESKIPKKNAVSRFSRNMSEEEEEFKSNGEIESSYSGKLDLQSDNNGSNHSLKKPSKSLNRQKSSELLISTEKSEPELIVKHKFPRRRIIIDNDTSEEENNRTKDNHKNVVEASSSESKKLKIDTDSLSLTEKQEEKGSDSEVESMESNDSDDEKNARMKAINVLDECRKLSDKLTTVISSWTSKVDNQEGALCLNEVS